MKSDFFRGYLESYLYWLSFSLGSLALTMIYRLTGGAWGRSCERNLHAASRTLIPFALFFFPILLGVHEIYPWASSHLPSLRGGNRIYLQVPFFSVRAVLYLLLWIVLAWRVLAKRAASGKTAAAGLVLLGMSTSFASFDWQMSLEPAWVSTMYGLVFGMGQVLQAWSVLLLLFSFSPEFTSASEKTQRDCANLLLAFVMMWAYLSFMQFLIIWSGNLPEEVSWIISRTQSGWKVSAFLLMIFQFFLPFSVLLFRFAKSRRLWIGTICVLILLARVVEQDWMISPAFHPTFYFNEWALPTFLALGGAWILFFLRAKHREGTSHAL